MSFASPADIRSRGASASSSAEALTQSLSRSGVHSGVHSGSNRDAVVTFSPAPPSGGRSRPLSGGRVPRLNLAGLPPQVRAETAICAKFYSKFVVARSRSSPPPPFPSRPGTSPPGLPTPSPPSSPVTPADRQTVASHHRNPITGELTAQLARFYPDAPKSSAGPTPPSPGQHDSVRSSEGLVFYDGESRSIEARVAGAATALLSREKVLAAKERELDRRELQVCARTWVLF